MKKIKGELKMIEIAGLSNNTKKRYGDSYGQWRNYNKGSKNTFHILPSGISNYLPYFSGKAMNLYLFYCLNSNNDTGESWYSTKTCSKKLQVTERSINNWNMTLEDIGLIVRAANNKTSKSTFLLPLSDYVITEEIGVVDYVKDYQKNEYKELTDGKLVSVINLFQWRKNPETKHYDVPYNVICLAFERTHYYEKADKKFMVRKFVLLGEDTIDQEIETKSNEFSKSVYRIGNEEKLKTIFRKEHVTLGSEVIFANLAINSMFNLKDEFKKDVLELCISICDNRDSMEEVDIIG